MRHNDSGKIFAPKCTHIHIFFGFKEMKHHADPPFRPWHRAENAEELLALSKKLGLTPKKAVEPKPLVYRDLLNGTSEPCKSSSAARANATPSLISAAFCTPSISTVLPICSPARAPGVQRPNRIARSTRSSTSKRPVSTVRPLRSLSSARCALRTERRQHSFPCSCRLLRPFLRSAPD